MAGETELADYADMQRAMERTNQIDVLDGRTCPYPDCEGTVVREEEGSVCEDCDRWLLRFHRTGTLAPGTPPDVRRVRRGRGPPR